MAEKTEKATPKKLRDARKKGQVAKSQDFPAAFTFVVSISTTLALSGYIYTMLSAYMVQIFSKAADRNLDLAGGEAGGYMMQAIMVIFSASVPILMATVCSGVLVSFLIIGPMFSLEAIQPKIEKLNPVANLKNMFKMKTFIELLKSIFKISGAVFIVYWVMKDATGEIVAAAGLPIAMITEIFSNFLMKVILRIGMFFVAIAIFDLVYQKKNFSKEMKMEKFEVKQEYKDSEGDPHIKGKRKQAAQEIAYQEGPRSVKRAKAIITNPVHIAVAVEYDEEKMNAPKIVTMGQGRIADEILKMAISYNIPVMRNVPLAHTLFDKGKIGQYIPEESFQAVAEILKWIQSLEEPDAVHDIFK